MSKVDFLTARTNLQVVRKLVLVMKVLQLSVDLHDRILHLILFLAAIAILAAIYTTFNSYSRLKHIPGPRFAALTNLVRRWWVTTGNAHSIHTDLHRKYGTVVRFGPNAVMISQPKAIDKIYGFKTRFEKACHVFP